jgi:hypothetical protein
MACYGATRSLDFVSASIDAASTDIGFNDWASTHESVEAAADLLRLLCYHSSASIPDYAGFYDACERLLSEKTALERMRLFRRIVSELKRRMEAEPLAQSALRAFLMRKLLFGYSTEYLSDTERDELFPDIS